MREKVAFDTGTLCRKVGHVRGAFQDRPFGETQVDSRLEEKCAGDEDALRNDNGTATLRCKLIDRGLEWISC